MQAQYKHSTDEYSKRTPSQHTHDEHSMHEHDSDRYPAALVGCEFVLFKGRAWPLLGLYESESARGGGWLLRS